MSEPDRALEESISDAGNNADEEDDSQHNFGKTFANTRLADLMSRFLVGTGAHIQDFSP